jgi:hypothetical protein
MLHFYVTESIHSCKGTYFFHLNEVHGMCHIFEAAEMLICSGCDSLQRRLEITELHIK